MRFNHSSAEIDAETGFSSGVRQLQAPGTALCQRPAGPGQRSGKVRRPGGVAALGPREPLRGGGGVRPGFEEAELEAHRPVAGIGGPSARGRAARGWGGVAESATARGSPGHARPAGWESPCGQVGPPSEPGPRTAGSPAPGGGAGVRDGGSSRPSACPGSLEGGQCALSTPRRAPHQAGPCLSKAQDGF